MRCSPLTRLFSLYLFSSPFATGTALAGIKHPTHLAIRPWRTSEPRPESARPKRQHKRWVWLGLVLLVAVAGFLRLPNLSYSEFQDDEVTVVWHSAEVIQGRADALFIHDKGPAEILQTAATYAIIDRMTERVARLPFTVAGLGGLLVLFLLGWRLFGPLAGWIAAMLLALDGYFIGFARIVQYQSLVFLMVVLVVLLVYKYVKDPLTSYRYIWLASAFFATGMLAHYEAVIAAYSLRLSPIPCTPTQEQRLA